MTALGFFLVTIGLLFFSSQLLTKALSRLLYRFFRSQRIVITLLALLFLPGVILHELAHFFMANVLFVKTGAIEFMPKFQGDTVKLGSVEVVQSDPLRRALIGLAPMLVGVPILLFALAYIVSVPFSWNKQIFIQYVVAGYVVFELGNTLFSSRKDMEGSLEFFGAVIFILLVCYFAGFQQPFAVMQQVITPIVASFLTNAAQLLLIPFGINVILYIFSLLSSK